MKTFALLLSLLLVGFYVLFNNVDRFSSDAFIQAVSNGKVVDNEWESFKRVWGKDYPPAEDSLRSILHFFILWLAKVMFRGASLWPTP